MYLKVGDKAPKFELPDQDGKMVSLADFAGKKLVLYFYPKDLTPGCTLESCNLRDNYGELSRAGYEVIGVSADSPTRHKKFISVMNLPFTLLADESKEMLKQYGAWGPKKFMGRTYDGIHRITYVIDGEGIITGVVDKVKTANHAAQIFELEKNN